MRLWNTLHATGYGAALGLAAAMFKLFGLSFLFSSMAEPRTGARIAEELLGATLAFALLCGLAAALRNFVLRRITGSESG